MKILFAATVGVVNDETFAKFIDSVHELMPECEVARLKDDPYPSPEEDAQFIEAAKGANIIITQYQKISDAAYDALCPDLKGVVAFGIGYNSCNVEYATKKGVYVANVPNYCLEEVAAHVVALLMAEQRRLKSLIRWIDNGNWGGGFKCIAPVKRLSRQVIGLYGFGKIAKTVAKLVSGFGSPIIAFDPWVSQEAADKLGYGVKMVDFDTLLAESDYISCHMPLLPSNTGVFNKDAFKKMKNSAVFINTARGGLTVPEDLYEALTTGEIYGAAIDAYITEPPTGIEKKISELDNVLSTPHVGYYTDDSFVDLMQQTAECAVDLLNGKDPGTTINKELWNK
ncbi:MAG: C-terminal binding protein [Lachnospiraceae bacterium]|nr:C-terminal binding protein [Lachnospiraceae bacterium]